MLAGEEVERFCSIYKGAGYEVVECSALTGEGIDYLRSLCSCGTSLLSGESGVGKSSVIKALDPSLDPKVGRISTAHLQGTHTHEPGCAVKAAVDEGSISPERYNSYLGMLEEDKKFR